MPTYIIHRTDDGETFWRVTSVNGDEWDAIDKFFEVVRASEHLDSDYRLQRVYQNQGPDTIRWAKPRDHHKQEPNQGALDQEQDEE